MPMKCCFLSTLLVPTQTRSNTTHKRPPNHFLGKIKEMTSAPIINLTATFQEDWTEEGDWKSIMIKDFLYEDITDGLEEKVNDSIKVTKEYFERMDKEHEAEIDGNNN